MIRTSYLRVYQPLSSFPAHERERWLEALDETPQDTARAPRRWLIASSFPSADLTGNTEGAFARKVEGEVLVCPWRTRLRMLAGLLAFRGSVPEEVADAFVPESEARRAAHELAVLGEEQPEVRSHILHANWHVPLRWFAAFDDSERILTEDKEGLRIRYETSLSDGRARLERAQSILEGSLIDEGVTEAVRELVGWLGAFPEDGLLELDYGSVASTFSDDDLVEDRSAAQVWACIDALAAGDVVRAGRLFQALTDRWTEVRSLEVLN
ncbi:MAG TPA: hypothetical protein VIG64_07740 [Actinomycetota bacterium]